MTEYTVPFTNQTLVTVTHNFGFKPFGWIEDSDGGVMRTRLVHNSVNEFYIRMAVADTGVIHYYHYWVDASATDLYAKIRAACGDYGVMKNGVVDTNSYMFRNDVIGAALQLAVLDIPGYSMTESGLSPAIANDLDEAIIIYYAATILLADRVNEMVSSARVTIRQEAPKTKLEFVATQLNRLFSEKGAEMGSWEGSLGQILNDGIRMANRIQSLAGTG